MYTHSGGGGGAPPMRIVRERSERGATASAASGGGCRGWRWRGLWVARAWAWCVCRLCVV